MQQVLQRAARVNLPPEAQRCPPSVKVPQVMPKAGGDAICMGVPPPTPFCPQGEGLLCSASEVTLPVPWGMHLAAVRGA